MEELLPQLRFVGYPLARARLDVERDNVREGLNWALQDGASMHRITLGLRLAVAFSRAWDRYGGRAEAQSWLERAIDLGSDDAGPAMAEA